MLRRRSILLAVAFASLLLVISGAALAVWRGAEDSRREVAALHRTHLDAGDALASIRTGVFLGGILTRDYLLDPDARNAPRYAAQLEDIRTGADRGFSALVLSDQSRGDKTTLDRLHREVSSYWDATTELLDWTPEQRDARRAAFLQQRARIRSEIMRLSDEVEKLLTSNFSRERMRIANEDNRFLSSLVWTTGIALILGLAISVATMTHIAALERRSAAADAELRGLSAQIRAAQEQERRFLSRELHDQAGQMLTGLRMELASISPSAGEEEFSARVSHAKGIVEQTLRVVRNIAMMLRPSMLDDLGLAAALGWLVRDVKRSSGIEICAGIDPALDALPDAQCTCVYRVVQEALTNAVRHSGAERIDIALSLHGDEISGSVADNGQGFEASGSRRRTGLGLIGMEERLMELGGSLRVVSSPGHGARIEFRVPHLSEVEMSCAVKA